MDEDDLTFAVGEAERQDLRAHRPDLARREIDHRGDLAAGQVLQGVMLGDLSRGALPAERRAEVDLQDISGLARLREGMGSDDGSTRTSTARNASKAISGAGGEAGS
jgi:hypothetical protein